MFLKACAVCAGLLASACAFTEYGNRINGEHREVERMERKYDDLEARYVIVLNNLEKNLGDSKLENERDKVKEKLQALSARIQDKRKEYAMSVEDWEKKIVQDNIQKALEDKAINENAGKTEDGEWHESK